MSAHNTLKMLTLFWLLLGGILIGCRRGDEANQTPAAGGLLIVPTSLPEKTTEPEEITDPAEPILIQADGEQEMPSGEPTTETPTAVPSCTPFADWPLYTVVRGDTLSALAASVGSTTQALAEANCLRDPGRLVVGSQLRLPQLPEPTSVDWPEPIYVYGNGIRQYGPEACYQPPFPSHSGITSGYTVRINSRAPQGVVAAYTLPEALSTNLNIADGAQSFVVGGPFCYSVEVDGVQRPFRRWALEVEDTQAYVDEFIYTTGSTRHVQLEPVGTPPRVETFQVSPTNVGIDQTFEVTWAVSHVDEVILYIEDERYVLPPSGSRTFKPLDFEPHYLKLPISLYTPALDDTERYLADSLVTISTQPSIEIRDFSVTPNPVPSNGSVTLRWDVVGEGNGRLFWYPDTTVDVLVAEILPGTGQLQVPLPDHFTNYNFVLSLEDRYGLRVERSILLETTCPYEFFVSEPDIQLNSCPAGIPTVTQAAYQPFERGFMVWQPLPSVEAARILVFTPDGSVQVFDDRVLDDDSPPIDEEPPPGLYAPVRGFGQVWAENPAVRSALGWGTAPEQSYVMSWQQMDVRHYKTLTLIGDIYITLPDSRVIRYTSPHGNPQQDWFFVE